MDSLIVDLQKLIIKEYSNSDISFDAWLNFSSDYEFKSIYEKHNSFNNYEEFYINICSLYGVIPNIDVLLEFIPRFIYNQIKNV